MTATTTIERAFRANGKQTLFESKTCGRCGGTGMYGPMCVYAGKCFGCSGTGAKLTKRGAAAQQRLTELLSKRTDQLVVGDKIFDSGSPFSGAAWRAVTKIENVADMAARGERPSSLILTLDEIEKIERYVDAGATIIPTTYHDKPAVNVYSGYQITCDGFQFSGAAADQLHRVACTGEQKVAAIAAAREFELTLTKTGQPRKR